MHVIQLLPSGASPHTYNLTPQQLADVRQAQILFVIGHGFDDWASDAITRSTNIPIQQVDQNISLRAFESASLSASTDQSIDPHYWLSAPNARQISATIASSLKQMDPGNSSYYDNNLKSFDAELTRLEDELQSINANNPPREFIAIHDAWGYLNDLDMRTLSSLTTGH